MPRKLVTSSPDVGQLAAIRAPRRRQQRLGRTHDGLRVVAIGVGHHQRIAHGVALAAGGHVGDAGPEGAAHTGDLLVDGIGHLVRDVPHGIAARGHRQAQQALALGHVEQFVLDAVGAGTGVEHAADHDVVLLQRAPGGELDVTAADRLFDDLRFRQPAEPW
ncbi:hypothetical protein G6F63_013969 [Rhizopus arrhizus]|nr:hypothetical protein G6F63_013969 [Rhizopus arrhizus]